MTYKELITLLARYIHRINDIDIVQMCGLAEGTNANTIKTITTIIYQLYNQQYTLTAADNIAMTACSAQAADTFCYYLISVDVSGTVTTTKGTDDSYSLPATPNGNVAIGSIKVTTVGVTFTSGTDDLSAAGITAEFFDIDCGIASTLINQAQRRIENGIIVNINGYPQRVSNFDHMLVKTTVSLTSGDYIVTNPIPLYKELVNAHVINSDGFHFPELRRMQYNQALYYYPYLTSNYGRPKTISRIPSTEVTLSPDILPTLDFLLRPTSDSSYTLELTAYQYSPELDGVIYTTNWWTQNFSEILLYGALCEAAPYLKNDERVGTWDKKLSESLSGLAGTQRLEKYSGSKANIQFVDPLTYGDYDITTDRYIV